MKKFMIVKIIITIIVPLRSYGLYYSDLYTDFSLMQALFKNCHSDFGYISLAIFAQSYICTVAFLVFKKGQKILESMCYPIKHLVNIGNHIMRNVNAIQNGEELPKENEEVRSFSQTVTFLETMSESVLQLCLSCHILKEFGLSGDGDERFNQLASLVTSILSICVSFAEVSS